MKFDGFEIVNADATDETNICHYKIRRLILSGLFLFCPPERKGLKYPKK